MSRYSNVTQGQGGARRGGPRLGLVMAKVRRCEVGQCNGHCEVMQGNAGAEHRGVVHRCGYGSEPHGVALGGQGTVALGHVVRRVGVAWSNYGMVTRCHVMLSVSTNGAA